MMDFLDGRYAEIILGIATVVLSVVVKYLVPYMGKFKEIKDVVDVTYEALEDGEITPAELRLIIKEIKDVVGK